MTRADRINALWAKLTHLAVVTPDESHLLMELAQVARRLDTADQDVTATACRTDTGEPFIEIVFAGTVAQLTPQQTRLIGTLLLTAADEAVR